MRSSIHDRIDYLRLPKRSGPCKWHWAWGCTFIHSFIHETDTGHSWNRPLTPLTFANVDQPGLYGNVQNENVGDSASSPLTIADISASIPSMVEATIFHSWHTLVIILTCMIVIVITISLFHTYSHSCPTLSMHESMSMHGTWMRRVKDYCLILLVRYSHISPTKILMFRIILRLIFSWLAH